MVSEITLPARGYDLYAGLVVAVNSIEGGAPMAPLVVDVHLDAVAVALHQHDAGTSQPHVLLDHLVGLIRKLGSQEDGFHVLILEADVVQDEGLLHLVHVEVVLLVRGASQLFVGLVETLGFHVLVEAL